MNIALLFFGFYTSVPLEVFTRAQEKCIDKGRVELVYFHEVKYKFVVRCEVGDKEFVYEEDE